MKRLFKTICILFVCLSAITPAFAQETEDEAPYFQASQLNRAGDQFIRVSISPTFPLNFPNPAKLYTDDRKLSMGGLGSLGFHHFLTDELIIGGDVGFGFNVTIGSHVFNYVPVIGTVTWQPCVGNFEFPLTMGIGFSWHSYIGYTYFPGLVLKPEAGVHYRVSANWSIGADFSYMLLPEFDYSDSSNNYMGQFGIFSLTARYYL